MEWLNYHHLFYFAAIAREGGLAAAARKLRLTHSTLSAQLRALESHFGAKLFERRGKRLVLTPFGHDAVAYADDIFRLGRELNDVARGAISPARRALRVGVVASLPKTLVHHLLAPALDDPHVSSVQLVQLNLAQLVDSLVAGRLHLALSDELPVSGDRSPVHAQVLGATKIFLYAGREFASALDGDFPAVLEQQPFVLPPSSVPLRRSLDAWLVRKKLRIQLRAEVEDAGLLRVFGSVRGIFPVRAALRAEVEDLHDVTELGPCDGVLERYYLLSTQPRLAHPALAGIVDGARRGLHAVPHVRKRAARASD
ncbi:MAG TPA: LysR family transcriptional regulator [Polyangiaceae bacterium]|nr:LysR family transcriptional regulator [Polyangiaceae bacterium]